MLRKTPLATGETYHVFNRGAHKAAVFHTDTDYWRFLVSMYLANNVNPVHLSNLLAAEKYQGRSLLAVFDDERPDKSFVDILAYCLMPNHVHMVVRQKSKDGISKFMRRVMTSYAMYYNLRYEHSGALFQGRFKSSHIDNEPYFRYIFAYVHLNPLGLIEPEWDKNGIRDNSAAKKFLEGYEY